MADDKTKRGSPDSKRLNRSEPYEMAYARSERASRGRKAEANDAWRAKPAGARATKAASAAAKSSRAAPAKSSRSASAKSSRSASPAMKRSNEGGSRVAVKRATVRPAPKPPKQEKTTENTAPKTMKEPDAVDLLTDDHLEVSALFKKYEKLMAKEASAEDRQALARTICEMLKTHTAVEEEIFYPAARQAGIDDDMLDEADVEHASAKDLIAQLESSTPDDDHYDAKVKVLGEYIAHHVVEEHTEMFPKCRRAGLDLVALRNEMELRKTMLLPGAAAAEAEPATESESPGILSKITDSLFSKSQG
ncbi:MAG TPA: hemerythrin domain-containing protein [Caldimonas sp.]|nr:hemerythrin domain-containing protein [Caldimonas sp.]HEX2539895.1 hemerythrin domain-containing protein [Caldimonas sp.]